MNEPAEYLPCPACGGTADELNWHGVMEYYGSAWQTCTLTCQENGRLKHCDFGVSLTVDADAKCSADTVESILIDAWNKLSLHYKEKNQ